MKKLLRNNTLRLFFLSLLWSFFTLQVAQAQCLSGGTTWTSQTSAANNQWQSVTYGNGLFVAVSSTGTGNRVMTSPDGINWTSRTSAANISWSSVTYGNGLFVAVGSSNIMTSPDGINWTSRFSAAANLWYSVTYGNGLFVAVSAAGTGNSNGVMTSSDGITWTSRSSAANNVWQSVSYGNGLFVAVSTDGTGNRVMTSPDGITWISRSSAADNQWFSVTYGNSLFVAVSQTGAGNRVMTSPDGITWTSRASAADNNWRSITYGNGLFVAVSSTGTGNRVMTSPDGITWTSRTPAADNNWGSITYGSGLFVAVSSTGTGNRVMTSPDGITWTSRSTFAADNQWQSVTFGNGLFVAVSNTGTGDRVMTSSDGFSWTSRISAANNQWQSIAYGNGLFVAVSTNGSGNRVMTSPDGINWTSRSSAADNFWYSVIYGNGVFVAVANSGTGNRVMSSPDGINWTSRTSAADNSWRSVTYGNGVFVAVANSGTGNRVMTSPDGINWTSRTSVADNGWISVTYGNGLFVAVSTSGTGNRVMSSPDGITWTSRSSAADINWLSVSYGNGVFVAVASTGTGNRVMTSPDGVTWTIRSSAADNSWNSVTYGNGLFVAVASTGTGNRVMTSSITPSLTIAANLGNVIATGTSVIFTATPTNGGSTPAYQWKKNNMNVGSNSGTYTDAALINNDIITCVLTSNDPCALTATATSTSITMEVSSLCPIGITWTSRTSAADNNWSSVIYGNGLFVAVSTTGAGNRVMTSPDGINWTSRTSAADNPWTSLTYGNGLFVAVSNSGAGNRVMTSPNGINWTSRSSSADNNWNSVTYGNGIFVAVASSGTGNRVMTSPDGVNWTSRSSASDEGWLSVTYGNGLFVAVGFGLSSNKVMTSPDGITWTSRTSADDNKWWFSVTYGNGLFVAVAGTGTSNRVMTSPDGITWTSRSSAANNSWNSVTYGIGRFVAVSSDGIGNRVMTSPDGITWTSRTSASDNSWSSVTYGNGLFAAVAYSGTGNRVMTSSPALVTPSLSIAANPGNSITMGTSVTFTATPTNGGSTPAYQWKKNGNNVGSNSATYTDAALLNGDIITCILTSNHPCALNVTATSTGIMMTILSNSTNANLSALTLSTGTLSPAFASATSSYTASVSNAISSITLTPTKADANASLQVRVNGGTYASVSSGAASSALALNVGSNTINVLVTAQDASTKTYTITVTRLSLLNLPTISSFTPTSGSIGTLVSIVGTNLSAIDTLRIGGVSAIKISAKTDTLVAMVMPGAVTGSIYLANTGGTVTSGTNFTMVASVPPMAQQGNKLVGTGASGQSVQGSSVSLSADGNTAIVGAYLDSTILNVGTIGAVWIYTRSGGVWSQQGNKLVGTGGNTGFSGINQGQSVDISADGNTVIVGGPMDNNAEGAAWIFTRSGTTWSQQGSKLVGTGASGAAYQGHSVSISADGNTVLVGGYNDFNTGINGNGNGNGATWVFTRSNGVWSQQGSKLVGAGNLGPASQGYSVDISSDGNTAIIGGPKDNIDSNGYSIGATWFFTRSSGIWSQQGSKLVGTGVSGVNANQGSSVALSADGNTAIVGGPGDSTIGASWVFMRSGSTWSQQGNKLVGTGTIGSGNQGNSVSLSADGNTAMIGGWSDDSGIGATWVFNRSGSAWTQQGSKLLGTGAIGLSNQGYSVSLCADGNTAIVGGHNDDSNIGAAWVFNGAANTVQTQLSLTAFLEGLYLGSSTMTSAPNNAEAADPALTGLTSASVADTILVQLHDGVTYDSLFSWRGPISTLGVAMASFPGSVNGNSYYIVIKHRNSLETWSSSPVSFGTNASYNFSAGASQAYGDNMVDMGSGVYGIFTGDINQDGEVNSVDYTDLDPDQLSGVAFGYRLTDLNGDGEVNSVDYVQIDQNQLNSVYLLRP